VREVSGAHALLLVAGLGRRGGADVGPAVFPGSWAGDATRLINLPGGRFHHEDCAGHPSDRRQQHDQRLFVEPAGDVTIIDAGVPGYYKDIDRELAVMGRRPQTSGR